MAAVSDIDTQGLVSKFLQRQIFTPSSDNESDTAEELQALLETIATSFLLAPQAALPLVLRARNALRQLVVNDIEILDFITSAIADIRNPDLKISDTSDLIEAQTALVELDRLGRVGEELRAFQRYKAAINRFLDDQLAPSLKRNARKEFERTGVEAREDVFSILTQFSATHQLMAERLAALQSSVTDFRSVSLTALVSARTVTEVRNSISQIQSLIRQDDISKTVVAIELLAGAASLESIADNIDIYDPTISTVQGLPPQRTIRVRPEQVGATALSTEGPWDASGPDRVFSLKLNPFGAQVVFALELPDTGVEDSGGNAAVYVTSSEDAEAATYDVPVDGHLYVRLEGATTEQQEVPITSGTRTTAQILADLNSGLTDAVAIAFKGTDRFLIYATDPAITAITVLGGSSGVVGTAAAIGALSLTGQPLNGEVVVIGTRTFTFESVFSDTPNFVLIGATASDSLDNLINALNNGPGEGTVYGTGTVPHADVTAAAGAGDTMVITAQVAGIEANSIALSTTITAGFWSTTTMVGGGSSILNSGPSIHDLLGFSLNQRSLTKGEFSAESLRDALEGRLPGVTLSVEGDALRLTSNNTNPVTSSLKFDDTVPEDVQGVFGFTGVVEAQPSYLELVEDGAALFPGDENVFPGSTFTVVEGAIPGSAIRSLNGEVVTSIVGTQISFSVSSLPRGELLNVEVESPDVLAVQRLIQSLSDFVGAFDGDVQDLQLALSPILSSPTQAQVNDALRVLSRIRAKLTDENNGGVLEALDSVVVRLDQSPFAAQAETIVRSLEERGLDRAGELLSTAQFSAFFSLTKNTSSRAGRLLRAMEQFVSTDIPIAFDEETIEDDQIADGENPNDPLDEIELALEDDALVEER